MRNRSTRVLWLGLPLALALGCDPGSSGTYDGTATGESPNENCPREVDEDGDGHARTDRSACPNPSSELAEGDDCDDTNAHVYLGARYFEDADGDGYGDGPDFTWACEYLSMPGYARSGQDCAPADPNRQVELYFDGDGDGVGAESECVAADSPDHMRDGGDCDDGDPTVLPGQSEGLLDGVDSDCDGNDQPVLYCVPLSAIEMPEGAECEGVGLAILAGSTCPGCGSQSSVSIVNMGSESAPATKLRAEDHEDTVDIPPLAPGETTEVSLPHLRSKFVIELPDGFESCAPPLSTRIALSASFDC